jgi:hypothetical protein
VTIFDSAVNIENYVTFVATDNHGAGCTAARKLAELTGSKGKVAMVMQKPGGTSTGCAKEALKKPLPGSSLPCGLPHGNSEWRIRPAPAQQPKTFSPLTPT